MDLELERAAGGWSVARHRVRVLPVPPDAPVDPAAAEAARAAHQSLLAITRRPVGSIRVALHSHFAVIGHDPSLAVVADAKRAEARRLLRDRTEAALPILCSTAPFKSGGRAGPGHYIDIPPGPLAFRQAADLYIYPNTFVILEISRLGLRTLARPQRGPVQHPRARTDGPTPPRPRLALLSLRHDRRPRLGLRHRPAAAHRLQGPGARPGGDPRPRPAPRRAARGRRRPLRARHLELPAGAQRGLPVPRDRARAAAQPHPPPARSCSPMSARAPWTRPPAPAGASRPSPGTAAWFDSGPGALAHLGEPARPDRGADGPRPGRLPALPPPPLTLDSPAGRPYLGPGRASGGAHARPLRRRGLRPRRAP
jgi:2',3'-cyclic-nucleotide 2'-phosphodiesterase/3'-nucleotidase